MSEKFSKDFEQSEELEQQDEILDIKKLQSKIFEEAEKIKIEPEDKDIDGNLLVFPEGSVSNLNEKQWRIVRTESFKQWFGDWQKKEPCSVVIDENGEPKILTHRPYSESVDLLPSREDFSVASRFLHFTSKWVGEEPSWKYGKNIHFVFLNIHKLLNTGAGGMYYYDSQNKKAGFTNNIDDGFFSYLIKNGYDGVFSSGPDRSNHKGSLMYTDEYVVLNPESQVLFVNKQTDSNLGNGNH